MSELTQEQIDQQDFVDGTIHSLLEELTSQKLDHDIEVIGEIRDTIIEVVHNRYKIMVDYP